MDNKIMQKDEIIKICERITALETSISVIAKNVYDIENNHLHSIETKIDSIQTDVLSGRPSWAVTIVLTVLSSLVIGMFAFILANYLK